MGSAPLAIRIRVEGKREIDLLARLHRGGGGGNRERGTGNREQGTGNRERGTVRCGAWLSAHIAFCSFLQFASMSLPES